MGLFILQPPEEATEPLKQNRTYFFTLSRACDNGEPEIFHISYAGSVLSHPETFSGPSMVTLQPGEYNKQFSVYIGTVGETEISPEILWMQATSEGGCNDNTESEPIEIIVSNTNSECYEMFSPLNGIAGGCYQYFFDH